jgi:hypothetical protein
METSVAGVMSSGLVWTDIAQNVSCWCDVEWLVWTNIAQNRNCLRHLIEGVLKGIETKYINGEWNAWNI